MFRFFGIPSQYQHRVLFYGILGAMVSRAGVRTLQVARLTYPQAPTHEIAAAAGRRGLPSLMSISRPGTAFIAALAAAVLACAGGAGAARVQETRSAFSRPEPDPSCRWTVRAPLAANGLEQVTVKVAIDRSGKLTLLEFLSPDLTPAAARELRQAFEKCVWKPGLDPDARPVDASAIVEIDTAK